MPLSKNASTSRSVSNSVVRYQLIRQTGEFFACKVLNKKFLVGREHMVSCKSDMLFLNS